MGRLRKRKHRSTRKTDISSESDTQTKLPSKSGFRHITKSDINDFLIPVIKEVGKCIFPPAAVPIEIIYQIYKHADAIKKVSSAVMKGDYEQAAKVIVKESIKEGAGMALGAMMEPTVNQASEILSESAKNLTTNKQSKEIAGNVVKGATKGFAEAGRDKIVDKAMNEVLRDEK
jgi:hypothetical protein